LLKYAFLIAIAIIAYVAYTGIDITQEYGAISDIRNKALNGVVDPLAKDILKQASQSNLKEILENSIEKYNGENNEM